MRKMSEIINESLSSNVNIGLQSLKSELLYLTEGNNQVGSLILIYNEKSASIFSVQVLSDYRGKGYGKRLVENAINHCKNKGYISIELNTEIDNMIANNLYIGMGFELKGLKDGFNNYLKSL